MTDRHFLKLTNDTEIVLFCKMTDLDEEFVPIPGFERYMISKSGTIKNVMTGRIMSQYIHVHHRTGYKSVMVNLYNDDGTQKICVVSRLLAKAFIPNPENKPQVDHIDRNSTNNDLSNLRWATPHEQMLNQHHPIGASGHKYIHKHGNGYRVRNPELKTYSKTFKSLDEAIAARAILMPEEESSPT